MRGRFATDNTMTRILIPLLSASLLLCSSAFSQETQPPVAEEAVQAQTLAQEIAAGIAGLKDKSFEFDISLESKGDGEANQVVRLGLAR